MDALSAVIIHKALDSLSLRQSFLAQNIANANTADYRAIKVTFEDNLRLAAKEGVDEVQNLKPKTEIKELGGIASDLRLDMELATASQTAMRYSALIEVLGRQMSLMRSVVSGGQ